MKRGAVLNVFREPTIELPQPFYLASGRILLSTEEPVYLLVPDAEALLRVLLDICPNAQNAVDDWLARERLMIVESGGREP